MASLTTSLGALPGVTTGGSETQAFCYDEQDRLVWASTQTSGPCGRSGSEGLSGAGYTASYSYDPVGRIASQAVTTSGGGGLTGAAQGSYTYGESAHVHAVTAVGNGGTPSYSAAYDAAGDMTCRALNSYACNNPTPSGQTLTYDALRRLASWQNGSTSSEQYAYDGEGNRVWRQTVSGSTTTTTVSILGVEDVTSVSGGATTATRYYSLPGGVTATRDSSGLVYEASDQLGTPIAALNLSSGITGEQLRAPYGQARYAANGTGSGGGMRTPYGFTGQREDTQPTGSSGLDDFNARMYDSVTGRFSSADGTQPAAGDPAGMDTYAYVGGMVENATDPSGQTATDDYEGMPDWVRNCILICGVLVGLLEGYVHTGPPDWIQNVIHSAKVVIQQLNNKVHNQIWGGNGDDGGTEPNGGMSKNPGGDPIFPRRPPGTNGGAQANKRIKPEDRSHKVQQARTSPGSTKSGRRNLVEQRLEFSSDGTSYSVPLTPFERHLAELIPNYGYDPPSTDAQPNIASGCDWLCWLALGLGTIGAVRAGSSYAPSSSNPAGTTGGQGGGNKPSQLRDAVGCNSFAPATLVATEQGLQAIGTLQVGQWVWAYNVATKRMELRPILHVFHTQDNNLLDLWITIPSRTISIGRLLQVGGPDPLGVGDLGDIDRSRPNLMGETIYTTTTHPFLTREQGWVPAGHLVVGMHVLRTDGTVGIVMSVESVSGVQAMDNLEVAQDHTFAVGTGEWIVHNACDD